MSGKLSLDFAKIPQRFSPWSLAAVATIAVATVTATAVFCPGPVRAQSQADMPPPIRVADTGGLEASSAALILSGQEGGELAVAVQAIPLPGDGPKRPVSLWVEMEAASLLDGHEGDTLIAEIYAYALDVNGGIGGFLTQAISLNLKEVGQRLLDAGGLKFVGQLELEPDSYRLQVLVRQRVSTKFSLQTKVLNIRSATTTASTDDLLPIFPGDPDSWLLVGQARKDETPADLPVWNLSEEGEVPATLPVISGGTPTSFFIAASALEEELEGHLMSLTDRQPVHESPLVRMGEPTSGPLGLNLYPVLLPATRAPAGQYILEVRSVPTTVAKAEDPLAAVKRREGIAVEEDEAVEAEPLLGAISIVVLPEEVTTNLPLWTQLRAPAPQIEDSEVEELSIAEKRRAMSVDRWRTAYREALLDPKSQNAAPASLNLTRLEHSQLAGDKRKGKRADANIGQMAAVLEMTRNQPESLVAFVQFHERKYRRHHQNKNYLLATHARQMSVHLAEAYFESTGTEGARRIAAANLVSIAGYLQEIGSVAGARIAFEAAREFDPLDEAALLGLGVILETYSEYEAASEVLRELAESKPKIAEATLRLAVNLQRIGKSKEAKKLFRKSFQSGKPPWVRAVAYQQMASLLTQEKKLPEAIEVLQEALRELPSQQRMYIQLAASYDAVGRPAAAREVLGRLDTQLGAQEDSPRLVYWSKPTWAVRKSRRFLRDTARNRLQLLGQVLTTPTNDMAVAVEAGN